MFGKIISGILIILAIASPGCKTTVAETRPVVNRWLGRNMGKTKIDIGGLWENKDWGIGKFVQDGSIVSGVAGDYSVDGRINGRIVYLSLWYENALYYTTKLKLGNDNKTLIGKYYYTTKQTRGWNIMLVRR